MSFEAYLDQDRRLVILRLLTEAAGYQLNSAVLQTGLDQVGHAVSRDAVHGLLCWLDEQRLVTLDSFQAVLVATATQRGLDVAAGRATVPGVKRPGPGA